MRKIAGMILAAGVLACGSDSPAAPSVPEENEPDTTEPAEAPDREPEPEAEPDSEPEPEPTSNVDGKWSLIFSSVYFDFGGETRSCESTQASALTLLHENGHVTAHKGFSPRCGGREKTFHAVNLVGSVDDDVLELSGSNEWHHHEYVAEITGNEMFGTIAVRETGKIVAGGEWHAVRVE